MENWFYGIEGLEIIGHGEWSDPELLETATGERCNYYDVENDIYCEFVFELKRKYPNITPKEIDEHTEKEFDDYVKANADLVWEYFGNAVLFKKSKEEN